MKIIFFLLLFAMILSGFVGCEYRVISANRKIFLPWLLIIIASVLLSCSNISDDTPNYDVVFEQGVVKRLAITIKPEDWQAMWENMVGMLGEFGQEIYPPTPPAWIEECEGKQTGDPCTARIGKGELDGRCLRIDYPDRVCIPLQDTDPPPLIPEKPIFRPCTLVFQDNTWHRVGIRFRGNSSLSSPWHQGINKLPFSFDFDEFEDEYPGTKNQRFFGFKDLAMINNYNDLSLLRDKVVADIFREAGVPAPRTAFYRLFVDFGEGPTYFGLYTMIELPREPMFETQFGATGGNLYKPEGEGAHWVTFDEESFEKKANTAEGDWSDIKAAFAALHASREDLASWRTGLEEVFDVKGFLRWLAVNTVIQKWDTYGILPHNYYLYTDPADDRLHWIPWDNNTALRSWGVLADPPSLSLTEIDESWPLIRFLMDDPVYRANYIFYVYETIQGTFDLEAVQEHLKIEHDLIAPYVTGPEGEQPGYTFLVDSKDFSNELDTLLDHVAQRNAEVLQFLEDENFEPIKVVINELHYNPSPAQGNDDEYEFIELYNAGESSINLSGYAFTDGIEFTFPHDTSISPDEYILIAKNGDTYTGQGYQVFQWVSGNLSNGGEALQLEDASGVVVDYLKYDDRSPWPTLPDSEGPSLELINASRVNYLPENWRASDLVGGTPGQHNSSLVGILDGE